MPFLYYITWSWSTAGNRNLYFSLIIHGTVFFARHPHRPESLQPLNACKGTYFLATDDLARKFPWCSSSAGNERLGGFDLGSLLANLLCCLRPPGCPQPSCCPWAGFCSPFLPGHCPRIPSLLRSSRELHVLTLISALRGTDLGPRQRELGPSEACKEMLKLRQLHFTLNFGGNPEKLFMEIIFLQQPVSSFPLLLFFPHLFVC